MLFTTASCLITALVLASPAAAVVNGVASKPGRKAPEQLPSSSDVAIQATGPIAEIPYHRPATAKYDYASALHMSYLFYHAQISGKLQQHRLAWRDDSCFKCKGDFGEDLSGGWFEAANTMKWGQPYAWTFMQLVWNVFEFRDALASVNELQESLFWVRHGAEYTMNLFQDPGNGTQYVMGVHGISANENGDIDFGYYGPAEEYEMWVPFGVQRQAFYCKYSGDGNGNNECCSEIAAGYASGLAAAAVVLRQTDSAFADQCYAMAQKFYNFADKCRGSYNDLQELGFRNMFEWYPSTSYTDELANAAVWLHLAAQPTVPTPTTLAGTDSKWLPIALKAYVDMSNDPKGSLGEQSWDNTGATPATLLFRITGNYSYMADLRRGMFDCYLDVEPLPTSNTKLPRTPRGLVYFETWGSLGYATAVSMVSLVMARAVDQILPSIPKEKVADANLAGISANYSDSMKNYAVQQVNYALGDCGRSWVPGFGTGYPKSPYHKSSYNSLIDYPMRGTEQGVVGDNFLNSKTPNRFILYGALGGGPAKDDSYYDDRVSYVYTEVTQDANAGYTGALAGLIWLYSQSNASAFSPVSDCKLDLGWTHKNASEATRRQKWPSGDCYHTCDPCSNNFVVPPTNGTTGNGGNGSSTSGGNGTNTGGKGSSGAAASSVSVAFVSVLLVAAVLITL